jgi:5-methylcytosine-specific restriction endonuclease McrA
VNDLTDTQWQEIKKERENRCYFCAVCCEEPTQEHLQPLSRGASHKKSNVVPACRTCNSMKGKKTEREYRDYLEKLKAN